MAQRPVLGHAVQQAEIATGRECSPLTGDDGDARLGVGAQLGKDLCQAAVQLVVHGIELVGPGEAHDAHRAIGFDLDDVRQLVVEWQSAHIGK